MNIFKHGFQMMKRHVTPNSKHTHFHSLNSPKLKFHQQKGHFSQQKCNIHEWRPPRTPELIYVPHVMRWLKTKIKFKYLKKTWDPEFSEGAFIYGSTHAICRITEIINENKFHELKNLITPSIKVKMYDQIRKLSPNQRKMIKLKPSDIKLLVPLSVTLRSNGVEKICCVNLRLLALKWFEIPRALRLVLVALETEFSRDYTKGATPEWTISGFDIIECTMLDEIKSR